MNIDKCIAHHNLKFHHKTFNNSKIGQHINMSSWFFTSNFFNYLYSKTDIFSFIPKLSTTANRSALKGQLGMNSYRSKHLKSHTVRMNGYRSRYLKSHTIRCTVTDLNIWNHTLYPWTVTDLNILNHTLWGWTVTDLNILNHIL